MADPNATLELLIQARTAGIDQVKADLKAVEAQAAETGSVVRQATSGEFIGSAGQRIIDTTAIQQQLDPAIAQLQAFQAQQQAAITAETAYANQYAAEWVAAQQRIAEAKGATLLRTEEETAAEAKLAA